MTLSGSHECVPVLASIRVQSRPLEPSEKKAYIAQLPSLFQIDASSLLRHFVFFTKAQCLILNRCDSASHHRFSSLLRRALFRSLTHRFIMFSRRSHYTETSFSKHRAARAASKSKRSFQEHARRPQNKRPTGSPPTGRYIFLHSFRHKNCTNAQDSLSQIVP